MAKGFIELETINGELAMINIHHIAAVLKKQDTTYIVTTANGLDGNSFAIITDKGFGEVKAIINAELD